MQHVDPYKTASELGVTQREREALIAVMHDMQQPDATIKMAGWSNCIGGKMYLWQLQHGDMPFDHTSEHSESLQPLFLCDSRYWGQSGMHNATAAEAASAIRTFLMGMMLDDFGALVPR